MRNFTFFASVIRLAAKYSGEFAGGKATDNMRAWTARY